MSSCLVRISQQGQYGQEDVVTFNVPITFPNAAWIFQRV